MSASIYYKPVLDNGVYINIGLASDFATKMDLPRNFSDVDIQFLRGVATGNEGFKNGCDEIIDAIEKHGTITVFAEY